MVLLKHNFLLNAGFALSTGLKITDETLEDRLAYDEIFVEYFNAFLALPVRALTPY